MVEQDKGIDNDNLYRENDGEEDKRVTPRMSCGLLRTVTPSAYEKTVKPVSDKILSFVGLVVLAPLIGMIALVVFIDDPGPVFFTQKRVGKDKAFFMLHKFRTMKMNTPHDVPTHQLKNPEQYITRIGGFLRRTSLDELPQIWDIFRGKMSVIGPRPALWNQDDLIAERERYGANNVLPGLTGPAQVKGRDKLLISDKAKLDGEYVATLRKGSLNGLWQDFLYFNASIAIVILRKGVVEGGTGTLTAPPGKFRTKVARGLEPTACVDVGFEEYGYKKKFSINKSVKKKVLITGVDSYIGESFKSYCEDHYTNIDCTAIDMAGHSWCNTDFKGYDAIFHVAGIAHADIGHVDEETKAKYYAVNTDLAIETAQKAKEAGVGQFLFMSSMVIYGASGYVDENTVPAPDNFYGDSKWQADKGVRALNCPDFRVAVLRLPMVYGRGSKGNYPALSKIAQKLPVFPNYKNRRSMLYIENLCEFVAQLVLSGESGIFFPQNSAYIKTSSMVKAIGEVTGAPVKTVDILNPFVALACKIPGKVGRLVKKAFGSSYYSQKLSRYEGMHYRKVGFLESVKRTEGAGTALNIDSSINRKRVLILVNHEVVIYNFRLELVEKLLSDGYEVHISTPPGERIEELRSLGAVCHDIEIDRHGMNPIAELSILREYRRLNNVIHPIIVLGYTIKPNIYGAMAASQAHIPFLANITGLGTAVENGGWKQKMAVSMYKAAFRDVQCVFFQNKENEQFFQAQGIAVNKHKLLPGSGVNLERYPEIPLPICGDGKAGLPVKFAFISRIMKEKGIDQYLGAAEVIKKKYPNTEFHVCGFCETEYDGRLGELNRKGVIQYHGMVKDVAGFMGRMHCIIHPTYYPEGLSNVLLEASACGRAIITTDRAGCREVVEGNGYLVPEKDVDKLVEAIVRFILLPHPGKIAMGKAGRKLVEERFDRQEVVRVYMEEIQKALGTRAR